MWGEGNVSFYQLGQILPVACHKIRHNRGLRANSPFRQTIFDGINWETADRISFA